MGVVTRRTVLMIEVDGDPTDAAERVVELVPDATVWGEVDGVDAALLVVERDLVDA